MEISHLQSMMEPRGLPNTENVVKYELYLSGPADEKLIEKYKKYVSSVIPTTDNDGFKFDLIPDTSQNLCFGSLKFDQNIEDEWLIVYLLYELSKFDTDLVIKVFDDDGDLLLIEAAEHLPRWLESSRSENRIFIHQGKLHIIPENIDLKDLHINYTKKMASASTNRATLSQVAAQFIRDTNSDSDHGSSSQAFFDSAQSSGDNYNLLKSSKVKTLANPTIQNAIIDQLCGLPDKKAWLSRKFKQLEEIITENGGEEDNKLLQDRFNESLTLASVMAMNEDDLRTSPISSVSSFSVSPSSSSSSWLNVLDSDEEEDDEDD